MLLLRGATLRAQTGWDYTTGFNTCSSCEEQQTPCRVVYIVSLFQYMLLLRGATRASAACSATHGVSIHAPLARSNSLRSASFARFEFSFNTCSSCEEQHAASITGEMMMGFNTCSSCEEQHSRNPVLPVNRLFQYMLLLRGATPGAVCGEGPVAVSIHAPLARSNF